MMHDLLIQALSDHADRIAVVDASTGEQTAYRELGHMAVGLDHALQGHDVDVLIIVLPKSALFYAAVVRCLVLALPFCCVDEDTPAPRLGEICRQFENPLLLGNLNDAAASLADFTWLPPTAIQARSNRLVRPDGREDAHYYVATSGSTGKPKLVKGRQSSLAAFATWSVPFYEVNVDTRWAQFSSTGFDLTLVDIVTVLSAGGMLVALTSQFDRLVPTVAIDKFGITHWHSVPSAIPYLLSPRQGDPRSLPVVFTFCGEPLHREPTVELRGRYPEARVINTYGPTEGTLFFMAHEVRPSDLVYKCMPLGSPIPGWSILLRPVGAMGEVECIVVSDLIAEGYVGHESSAFGTCDLDGRETRSFRTGDMMTIKDNMLFFDRRDDQMVKIRGARIDLGEVESIARLGGASNPVAFKHGGRLHLVFEQSASTPTLVKIKEVFNDNLPEWLHPSFMSCLDLLPRTTNGKIDRTAVRAKMSGQPHEQG